jgi:hypothetical protein
VSIDKAQQTENIADDVFLIYWKMMKGDQLI